MPRVVRVGAGTVALSAAPEGADQAAPLSLELRRISVSGTGQSEPPHTASHHAYSLRPQPISPSTSAHFPVPHPTQYVLLDNLPVVEYSQENVSLTLTQMGRDIEEGQSPTNGGLGVLKRLGRLLGSSALRRAPDWPKHGVSSFARSEVATRVLTKRRQR